MNESAQPAAPADLPAALTTTAPGCNVAVIDAVMPRHVAAVVPFKDHEVFGKLAPEQKARVSLLLQLFAEMVSSPEGLVACSDRLAALNPGAGLSGSNLRRLYYAFKHRGWRALAKIYKGPEKLPADFVQEVRRLTDNNARSSRAVLTALKDRWAAGEAIAGYGTWREYHATRWPARDVPERYPFGFFPEGWSESNLYTKRSIAAQRKMKTHGYAAAKRYLPHVVRDTAQLRPLELITIDDFELDFLVRAFNPVAKRWEICRAAGLLAIDVATRRKLAVAIVPRFKLSRGEQASGEADETGEEKKRRIAITRHDVQSLLHLVFSTHGRPADYGCTILCENAAAAITGDGELALELLLGVQVARTGLIDNKTLGNGFVQGGGKPWQKGWIESLFNLIWNTAGALPGQKGSSYQLKPADLAAKLLYSENLLKLDGLPVEVAAELRLPFFTIAQALEALDLIFARIELRTDHKCQGFEQLFDYQLPDTAGLVPESALDALAPEVVLLCTPMPRAESPVERWSRLRPLCRFEKIADYVLACLLLTPKRITLRNLRLTFTEGGAGYTYADADSPVMKLDDGTELLGYFDPARPGQLYVTDLKGRYIGGVRRRGAIDIRDHAAISAESGEIERMIRSLVVNPLRERHAAEDAQLGADRAHNEALLREHNLLPDAKPSQASGHIVPKQGTPVVSTPASAAERPASLSRKLAQAPARDAFTAYKESLALAQGIAAEVGAADQRRSLEKQVRADAEHLSADDIEAATGRRPVEPTAPEQAFSSDEISDLLRD